MKKLISFAIAIIFAIGTQAQTTQSAPTNSTTAGTTVVGTAGPCVASMINGKMYTFGKGINVVMVQPMTFPNGTTVYPDGHYTLKDKRPGQLKNAECFDAKGIITKIPPPPPPPPAQK